MNLGVRATQGCHLVSKGYAHKRRVGPELGAAHAVVYSQEAKMKYKKQIHNLEFKENKFERWEREIREKVNEIKKKRGNCDL